MQKIFVAAAILLMSIAPAAAKGKIYSEYFGSDDFKYQYRLLKSKPWKKKDGWGFEIHSQLTVYDLGGKRTLVKPVTIISESNCLD